MSSPKILSVIGTRPEAIKMAPVIRALQGRSDVDHRIALTGQHTDMVDQILELFRLESDYDLELMTPDQSLYDIAAACLEGIRRVHADFVPDVTIVQGDTATVFFTALVTFFEKGRLAHVEAGLRSDCKWAPFPEEMLRRLTDEITDFCFAPTPGAADNLRRSGTRDDQIYVTGNTVVDALEEVAALEVPAENPVLAAVLGSGNRLVLLTAHRRESFGAPLEAVFGAVAELVDRFDDIEVLYPVHPNPNVRVPAERILGGLERVHLTEPLGYTDLVAALRGAGLVLTDSGGIQEEAPTFGARVLVLRDVTERPEAVEAGVATLVGTDADRILEHAGRVLAGQGNGPGVLKNPYGDGRAGERIADVLCSNLLGLPRSTADWDGA